MSQYPSQPQQTQPVLGYAGPMTTNAAQLQPYAWREDALLVVPALAMLPPRCVKCNAEVHGEPGSRRLTQKLAWHHPAFFLLILAGLLIYVIVALCIQQKATIEMSLCPTHAAKRRNWLVVAWVSAIVGIGAMIFGCGGGSALAHHNDMWPFWLIIGGILLALVGGVAGIIGARALTPKRIERGYAWLAGAHADFLAPLPDARQV